MNNRMRYDGRAPGLRVARMGTETIPSGTGFVTVNVTGLGLPSSSYVVVVTPNSTGLTPATSGYTTDGFIISVNRAAAGTYAVRWILVMA